MKTKTKKPIQFSDQCRKLQLNEDCCDYRQGGDSFLQFTDLTTLPSEKETANRPDRMKFIFIKTDFSQSEQKTTQKLHIKVRGGRTTGFF